MNKEMKKAVVFCVALLLLFIFLCFHSLSFWDGRVGIEDNGDGRIETLYVINPLFDLDKHLNHK